MRTSTRSLLAGALIAGLLAACGGEPTGGAAATVNGEAIPRDRVEAAVREIVGDEVGSMGAEQRSEAVSAAQASVLNRMITGRILLGVLDEQGVEVTAEDTAQLRADIVESVGGEEQLVTILPQQGMTMEIFEEVFLVQEAGIRMLLRQLAGDEVHETRTVRHILVETEDEAQDVRDQLDGGADFAELAAERSLDGSGQGGGELPPAQRGDYVPGFEEAAWEAELDEVVGPVESQFGWHVLEVIDETSTPASELSIAELEQVVGPEFNALLEPAFQDADVSVAAGLGTWVPGTGLVPEGEAGTPEPAPTG